MKRVLVGIDDGKKIKMCAWWPRVSDPLFAVTDYLVRTPSKRGNGRVLDGPKSLMACWQDSV